MVPHSASAARPDHRDVRGRRICQTKSCPSGPHQLSGPIHLSPAQRLNACGDNEQQHQKKQATPIGTVLAMDIIKHVYGLLA
jgi:hypothetical protein